MVHVIDGPGFFVGVVENISGTQCAWIPQISVGVNDSGQVVATRPRRACSFVVADWRDGAEPFCGAPAVTGSPYCARHEPLCIVPRDSPEGRSRVAALLDDAEGAPEPPPELAYLRESVLPELLPDDTGDLRAVLDYPPPGPGTREPE